MFKRKKRVLIAGGLLAALLCLLPARTDAPAAPGKTPTPTTAPEATPETEAAAPAGADLSARTQSGCMLHRTMVYAPCGHSAQRREALPARLVGLTHAALEGEIAGVYPGAAVTAFDAREVDITLRLSIPCPLHWVLAAGEDGMLAVMQNRTGDALTAVRETGISMDGVPENDREALAQGMIFDDVQALEGYLESLMS